MTFGKAPIRACPEDFVHQSKTLSRSALQKHYSAGWTTVSRWLVETGQEELCMLTPEERLLRVKVNRLPDDWADIAPTMYRHELSAHYRINRRVIRFWIAQTGVVTKKRKPVVAKSTKRWSPDRQWYPAENKVIDWSVAGQAADYLRRHLANVFKADLKMRDGSNETWGDRQKPPVPNNGKGFWQVDGIGVLSAEEIVEHAVKRGFAG